MRISFDEEPYYRILLANMFGKCDQNRKPVFITTNDTVEIENMQINKSYISESLYEFLEDVEDFTLSPVIVSSPEADSCYLGVPERLPDPKNGNTYDVLKAEKINAPQAEFTALVFECHITERSKGIGKYIKARIVNVNADESIVEDGSISLRKLFGLKGFTTLNSSNNK